MIELPASSTGHAAPLTHVALRGDGLRLATCSYDGTTLVWDTSDPSNPLTLARLRHRRLVNAAAWNPAVASLLATASADKTVAVWRVSDDGSTDLVNVLARHTDDINSIAWLPDGERLICVSEDGRATMWDALTGAFLTEVGSHEAHCMMVSVSVRGTVATVGEDGMVAVTELAGPGAPGARFVRRYASSIEGCAWSRSGEVLAVARDDGAVDLLTAELELVRTVEVSSSAARTVDWADDDSCFVVGAYDGSLHFFDRGGQRLHRVDDARVWPRSVSAARGLVAAGSFWGGPHILDLASGTEIAAPARPTHGPNALAVRGDQLLVGCDSGAVVAIGLDDDAFEVLQVADGPILSLAVRDGVLYAGTYSGHLVAFDGARRVSGQLGAPLPSLCLDGELLVAGTYNGEFIAVDPDTLAVVDRWEAHGGSVKSLAALPDGGFLSAATDRTVAIGSFRDRRVLWEHGNLVNAVAGLGGSVAASASRDHTVKVGRLDPSDGTVRQTQTLLGPDESVKCVGLLGTAQSPVVLAGSYDFGLYAWEVDWRDNAGTLASGRVVAEFGQGLSCMLRLDDDRMAAAGWDGRVVVVERGGPGRTRVVRSLRLQELLASHESARLDGEMVIA
ncbi:WD40 repeat domain-containing protein [Streptomyces sp. RPT161]|uniref:WD40 repeat domain-containing protein n=1 Tax=Streptomyces sp. RPT161 TaxID=3015993 RepID=UPI0022B8D038|nr:WD40 repeat domain-containing protein [Streptomyces sp. RPT161]